jgi:MFS family permease
VPGSPAPGGPRGSGRRVSGLAAVARNRCLRRALPAYLLFNVVEWATWIALLVWAYDAGGVTGASLVAVVQLVPGIVLAPVLAVRADRLPRGRALALGYATQGTAFLGASAALGLGAGFWVVVGFATVASVALGATRPVHHAMLPEVAETPEELTAGNAASGSLEAAAVVVGPLASSALILVWGVAGVLGVMGALMLLAAALVAGLRTPAPAGGGEMEAAHVTERVAEVLRDPTARVLTVLVSGEYVLVGMLDILLVVLALDRLGMSDAGPGLLNAMIGVGGLVGSAVALVLVGRWRLVPVVALGGIAAGVPVALAGLTESALVASAVITVCGCGKVVFDVGARTLVQRLLPPRLLTSVFGVQESVMDAGLAIGSLVAPGLVLVAGPSGALVLAGLFLPLLVLATAVPLRRLDRRAVVPRDVADLLRGVPFLALLEPGLLDRLAREARTTVAEAGDRVVAEGDRGDRFHVIESGTVEVTIAGEHVRDLGPGQWFGELALLRDRPRSATVTARERLTLRSVDRDTFLGVVGGVGPAVTAANAYAADRYR